MYCSRCGTKINDNDKFCQDCKNEMNHNDIRFVPFKNDINNYKKCPKCGYLNPSTETRCKNCECLLDQITESKNTEVNNIKVNKKKNIILFTLFSIIYFIFPNILIAILSVIDPGFKSSITAIIIMLLVLDLMFFIEPLTCLTVKKMVNNTMCMKQELLILEIILLITSIIFFKSYIVIIIILVFVRILTWFVTRSIFIKEKIKLKVKWIITFISTLSLVFIVSNLFSPTKINKYLYMAFGKPSNFTKDFYICLIDEYNNHSDGKDYTYFHKLTKKELESLTEIYIDEHFTNDDISKLKNVKKVYVSENVNLSNNMDFSKNTELTELGIYSNTIKKIKLPDSISFFEYSGTLDTLDISRLSHLNEIKTKVNNLVIKDLNQIRKLETPFVLFFNTLVVDDKKLDLKNGFISFRIFENYTHHNFIYLPEHTKISDIELKNLKMKITRFDEENENSEEIEDMDEIYFYDNNDNLILKSKVSYYSK